MPGAVMVRPVGKNSEYPPVGGVRGGPEMYNVKFDMGKEGLLEANVTNALIIGGTLDYTRFIGPVVARLGNQTFEGKAVSEEFRFRNRS